MADGWRERNVWYPGETCVECLERGNHRSSESKTVLNMQEGSGLKVSSLYISQVNRKCGLDVEQNYNLLKKRMASLSE